MIQTNESVPVLEDDELNEERLKSIENNMATDKLANISDKDENIDPWTHNQSFPCWWIILALVIGPVLLPLRVLALFLVCSVSYGASRIGLTCLHTTDQPFTGWRKYVQRFVFFTVRLAGRCLGVWMVRRGDQASVEDAPVIVVAPHSTILDWLAMGHTRSSPVAKAELSNKIFFGVLGRIIQTVWVDRSAENSRQESARMISRRSSEPGWPQTLIFPEGTNTNGKVLIRFRTGAFATSKPVQPVVFTFPNAVDTLTWTWIQRFKPHHLLLFTLLTPLTIIHMEFLPVITPSTEEEENPVMFADRVRDHISDHLQIPTVNVSFKDAVAAKKEFKQKNFPKDVENNDQDSSDLMDNVTLGI